MGGVFHVILTEMISTALMSLDFQRADYKNNSYRQMNIPYFSTVDLHGVSKL